MLFSDSDLHVDDDLVAQLFVGLLLLARTLLADKLLLELLVLLLAQLLVGRGDRVESLENFRLQFGFHRRERHGVFEFIVIVDHRPQARRRRLARLRAARSQGAASPVVSAATSLGLGAFVGRFEIDDVTQQNLAVVEFVAPDDDGLEGQRAFARPGDHRLAAGLDALGNGDFAFARQKLDRAHLAQIHAHRIVGTFGRLGLGLGLDDGGLGATSARPSSSSGASSAASSFSSPSSVSTTVMPMSESIA